MANTADGTPLTQLGRPGGPNPPGEPGAGGTYLYKFTATRPGIFWYHPHHFHSTNRVFRGLYGMIIVRQPAEDALVAPDDDSAPGILPSAANTLPLVLSDTSICPPVANAADPTYDPALPWLLNQTLADAGVQPGPTAGMLCYAGNDPNPTNFGPLPDDPHHDPLPGPDFSAGDIPNIGRPFPTMGGGGERTNEGAIVLTNGYMVGDRAGNPDAPGALSGNAETHPVEPGQGLRLQMVNCCTSRYFRLRLTNESGGK